MTSAWEPHLYLGGKDDQRATRAEIDLDVLQQNVATLKATLAPGIEMMAVVKANAYGHGARMVARAALEAGATRLAVATVSEGRQLRQFGIEVPVLVLSPITPAEAPLAIQHDLELTIATEEVLAAVWAASLGAEAHVGLHVKLDSGMHRYGAEPQLAIALAKRIAETSTLRLAGLMTHFAAADEPEELFTVEQAQMFEYCLTELAGHGIRPDVHHLANSAAALRDRRYHGSVVRFGIAMYGLPPSAAIALPAGVKPVMTLRSQVSRVHRLDAASSVGYGRTYMPNRPEDVALIPIGYADGYRRALSNQGWMSIGGRRAEVVGRVSMDQTVVRVPNGVTVAVGDEVVVLGGPDAAPTADELAGLLGTISYEIVTGIAARVPRHYLRDGQVIAVESLPFS